MTGGCKVIFDIEYDYLLFRQDWNSCELVYFNENDIEEVLDMIYLGDILIHNNYSVLYCANEMLLGEMEGILPCYATIFEEII